MKLLARFLLYLVLNALSYSFAEAAAAKTTTSTEDTSPFRMRLPHSAITKILDMDNINRYIKHFKNLNCCEIKNEAGQTVIDNIQSFVLPMSDKTNNTFDLVVLDYEEPRLYGLGSTGFQMGGVAHRVTDDANIEFYSKDAALLLKFRLVPIPYEEPLSLFNPHAQKFVFEGINLITNIQFFQPDQVDQELQELIIKGATEEIDRKLLKVWKRFGFLERKEIVEETSLLFVPFIKQVARFANYMKIEEEYIDIGLDLEHYMNYYAFLVNGLVNKKDYMHTRQTILKRKAKVFKPIATQFTPFQNQTAEAQFIINENLINTYLYDWLLYDNYVSVGRFLEYFDYTRDWPKALTLGILRPVLPELAEQFGPDTFFRLLFSFSYKKTKEQLQGLKMPLFQMDKNGNIRISFAINSAIDISRIKKEHHMAMEASIELKINGKIDKRDGQIYLILKNIEIGLFRIINWDGDEQYKLETLILGAANTFLPKVPSMIPEISLGVSRVDDPLPLLCFKTLFTNYDFKPNKKYAEFSFEMQEILDDSKYGRGPCQQWKEFKPTLRFLMTLLSLFMEFNNDPVDCQDRSHNDIQRFSTEKIKQIEKIGWENISLIEKKLGTLLDNF